MSKELVILVDENDREVGTMEKMEAHEKGLLHRAFSIFLFDSEGKLLLQQRSMNKYHSPGKWTNTCCSHQRSGETTMEAAKRRLVEELGIQANMEAAYKFLYKADVGGGLTEHELDHVLVGEFDGEVPFNPSEVMNYKYVDLEAIEQDMLENPTDYTEWFKITFKDLKAHVTAA